MVTDNGNFIIDAPFEREHMVDPYIVSSGFVSAGYGKITLAFRLWLGSRCSPALWKLVYSVKWLVQPILGTP